MRDSAWRGERSPRNCRAGVAVWLLCLCASLWSSLLSAAQGPAADLAEAEDLWLPALWVLHDERAALNIGDMLASTGGDPTHLPGWLPARQVEIRRYAEEPYWFYFRVRNNSDHSVDRVLDFPYPRLAHWRVYVLDGPRVESEFLLGSDLPFAQRPIPYLNLAVPLSLPPHSERLVVMSSRTYSHYLPTKLRIVSWPRFTADSAKEERWHIGYFGMMAAALIYNLMVWWASRNQAALLMAGAAASSGGVMAIFVGYLYLAVDTTATQQLNIFTILGMAMMTLPMLFTSEFLQLKRYSPRLRRGLLWVIGLVVAGAAIGRLLANSFLMMAILWVLFICVPLLLCIAVGIWQLARGNPAAPVYLISGLPLLMAQVVYLGGRIGIIPPVDEDGICAAQLFQFLVLSWALTFQVARLREDELRAQADSRAKSEFMAQMSHEIRNPMNAVLGMSELLRHSGLSQKQARYNDIIQSSGAALLTLLNDILDYARLEAGKLELEQLEFDAHELAMQTLSIFKGQVSQKPLELLCDIDPDLPRLWRGDPTRLRQIMLNLLSNAVKFTNRGAVTLSLSHSPLGLRLGVSDTGPGLSREQQQHLFLAFSQASAEVARTHGGSGLGLSICRSLAELMGGRIGVESEPGRGAHFWVDLPMEAKPEPPAPQVSLTGRRWLLVDTSPQLGAFIRRHAAHWGMEVQQARDGEEALALLTDARNGGRPFDLLSVDLHQGMSLLQQVRGTPGGGELAIIILAQVALLPDVTSTDELGVAEILEKPVSPVEMRLACARALKLLEANSDAAPWTAPAPMAEGAESLRILVAEDNPVNQQVILGMLRRLGHQASIASNGAEAIRRVKQDTFDLVLMDCDMPELDGWQAARAIREWEAAKGLPPLPIIALTGHTLPAHREECLAAGMQEQLAKPVSMAALQPVLAMYRRTGDGHLA